MYKIANTIFNSTVYGLGHLRAFFWRLFLKSIGKNVYILDRVTIMSPQNVSIGHDVVINNDVKIGGQNGATIGNYVLIGYNVNLVSENHAFDDTSRPIKNTGYYGGPIKIEDDVWIGANAVILPSVKIGRGSIIGANAVVTKDVQPYTIVGGIPARYIKKRFSAEEIEQAKEVDLS